MQSKTIRELRLSGQKTTNTHKASAVQAIRASARGIQNGAVDGLFIAHQRMDDLVSCEAQLRAQRVPAEPKLRTRSRFNDGVTLRIRQACSEPQAWHLSSLEREID